MREKIIIDTDPAIGVFGRDIDDGLAIALALNSPELEVLGLTVTHGNVSVENGVKCAHRLLNALGRDDIQVYKGASSTRGLGKKTEASEFIASHLGSSPGEVSIAAIGPLTNIATVEKLNPGILSSVKRTACMGGAVRVPGMVPPLFQSEFNFWKDAEAAHFFIHNAQRVTLAPLDVTMKVTADYSFIKELSRCDSDAARYIFRHTISWFSVSSLLTLPMSGRAGFFPHDPIALGLMLWPEIFGIEDMRLGVLRRGPRAGKVSEVEDGPEISVATSVDEGEFLRRLLDRLVVA